MDVVQTGIPKRRLALIAGAELIVLTALGIALWQVWEGRQAAPRAAPTSAAPAAAPATPTPAATPIPLPPDGTATPPASAGAGTPGAAATTLLQHLQQFNGVVGAMEGTESSVLQILIPGTVWYLQNVVVPDIESVFGGG